MCVCVYGGGERRYRISHQVACLYTQTPAAGLSTQFMRRVSKTVGKDGGMGGGEEGEGVPVH